MGLYAAFLLSTPKEWSQHVPWVPPGATLPEPALSRLEGCLADTPSFPVH